MFGKTTKDNVLMWVKTHILTVEPTLTWDEAKAKFQAEYAADDYAFKCRDKLLELTPGKGTCTSFLREIESLSVGAQQDLDDAFFKHVLIHKRIPKKIHTALCVKMGKAISQLTFAELKKQISYLDHVDLTNFSPVETKTPTGLNSSTFSMLTHNCVKCQRGNRGHLTSECKTHSTDAATAATAKRDREAAAKAKAEKNAEYKKNVVCTRCSNKGHYANDPSCPNRSIMSSIAKKVLALKANSSAAKANTAGDDLDFTEDEVAQALFDMHSRAEGHKSDNEF